MPGDHIWASCRPIVYRRAVTIYIHLHVSTCRVAARSSPSCPVRHLHRYYHSLHLRASPAETNFIPLGQPPSLLSLTCDNPLTLCYARSSLSSFICQTT